MDAGAENEDRFRHNVGQEWDLWVPESPVSGVGPVGDYEANLEWRVNWWRAGSKWKSVREEAWKRAAEDIGFYVNTFVWQYNPQIRGAEVGPWVLWDYQHGAFAEILRAMECRCGEKEGVHGHDLVIEKSREMGASWMCLLACEWMWHFHPNKKFLMISRNADSVDSEADDSLFWKLDFVHRYLPAWLMPKGWERKKHRRVMYFQNPENGSTITGQASTGKAGVGGRATAMFVDEFSQITDDYEVLHRTSDTTACRIFNFTHTNTGNAAAEVARRVDMRKLRLHWSQHPHKKKGLYRYDHEKNKIEILDKAYHFPAGYFFVMDGTPTGGPHPGLRSPWYDEQCRRKNSPRAVAMDLDIDVRGSMSQFFDAILIRVLQEQYAVPPYWEGDLLHDQEKGTGGELAPRKGGPVKLWMHQRAGKGIQASEYKLGVDCAAGTGATNSCISICDARSGEKVLEYQNPFIVPEKLAALAVALARLFADEYGEPAEVVWEKVGPGAVFGKRVIELGFRKVYTQVREDKPSPTWSDIPGWMPNPDSKRTLLEEYRAGLHSRQYVNRSHNALEECLEFRYAPNGTVEHAAEESRENPSGARSNHGDQTIADALSWKLARRRTPVLKARAKAQPHVLSLAYRRSQADNQEQHEEGW